MRVARLASCTSLEAENIQNPNDRNSVTELALLNNAIALGDFEAAQDVPMELTKQERLDYSNEPQPEQFRQMSLSCPSLFPERPLQPSLVTSASCYRAPA